MHPLLRAPLVLCLAFVPAPSAAQPAADAAPSRPAPRVALVLSGGGARGIAHVGALRALEEAGIPVDAIAANSMGSIVGAIYASGRDAKTLETIVRAMEWDSIFSGAADRRTLPVARRPDQYRELAGVSFDAKGAHLPAGLLPEHRVNRFLVEYLAAAGYAAGRDFDRLPIPFRAVATDIGSGERVVLGRGDLALAVRASMSIPLAFPPVDWEGRRLVDGLVVSNFPADVGRSFSPVVLVGVDIGSPPLRPEDYASAIGIATQMNDLLTRRRYLDFPGEPDVLVRPDLGTHSSTDYSGFDELIRKGYEATKAVIPEVRRRLEAAGVTDLAPRERAAAAVPVLDGAAIRGVAVRGNEKVTERFVRNTFNVPVGPPYSMSKGLKAWDKIDATDVLDRTWLDFEPDGDGVRVVLRVSEAPSYRAEVGGRFSEWEKARGHIRLHDNNLFGFGEEIDALVVGSDAETRAELGLRGERLLFNGLGYAVRGYWQEDKPRVFDADGAEVNRAGFDRLAGEFALAGALRRWFLVEAGMRFGRVDVKERPGLPFPEARDQVGAAFGRIVYDTLTDLEWAEYGLRLAAYGEWSPSGLGGDREYWRASLDARGAIPLAPKWTMQIDGFVGVSGRDLGAYDYYRVGGPSLIPGYHHEELQERQSLAAGLTLRYRLLGKLRVFTRVGAGNVFATTGDVTLSGLRWGVAAGAVYPSPVGPVSIEAGFRDGGSVLTSITIGWP